MIPYSYKFVDFKGTDLSTINGLTVEGIYNDIVTSLNRCGEVVLYNWFFASIPIAPSYCSIEVETGYIIINDIIEVREDDTVWVESLIPDPPTLVQLSVSENGQFSPLDYGADGFSEVDVDVPERIPVVEQLEVTQNGVYTPGAGIDGFTPVIVNVGSSSFYLEFQQGGISAFTDYRYDSMLTSSTSRIRLVYPIALGGVSSYSIVCNSGYNFALYAFNVNGRSYNISGVTGAWASSIIVPSGVYYLAILIRKEDDSNILPSEAQSAGLIITQF